jgi:uncharacterized protein YndB with AHSA1/START domain
MEKIVIKKEIEINASPENVWRVFTEPAVTKAMGGEYISDWEIGSSFNWKDNDGKIRTNGKIVLLEPAKLLKHYLFKDNETLLSTITYQLKNKNGKTILSAHEKWNFDIDDEQFKDASEGWEAALNKVKEIAEKL